MDTLVANVARTRNLDELLKAIRRCPRPWYGFVGAGLSCIAGGPTWEGLLNAMGAQLQDESTDDDRQHVHERFMSWMREGNLKRAAETWQNAPFSYDLKQNLLNDRLDLTPSSIHKDLMHCGLQGILTTNYDHLLEDAYAETTGRSLAPYLPDEFCDDSVNFGRDLFIAKLHGDMARWRTIIIGEKDYKNAHWSPKAKDLVNRNTLLVFGVGLVDSLINEFLFDLSPETRVHVFLPGDEIAEYRIKANQLRNDGVPPHVQLHPVSHEQLPELIHQLKPAAAHGAHLECEYGDIPLSRHPSIEFGSAERELREFLFSNGQLAHVETQPGFGLSSFLAQVLANRKDALIVRFEAKEWLCWDKYLLQLLGKDDVLLKRYGQVCDRVDRPCLLSPGPSALAVALGAVGRSVIICFEQSHRLGDDTIVALQAVVEESVQNVKIVLASSARRASRLNAATIRLVRPRRATLVALAQRQGISPDVTAQVFSFNDDANLNTVVLAGALLQLKKDPSALERLIADNDHRGLCEVAIDHLKSLKNDDILLRVLKTAVLFRSPRTVRSIQCCLQQKSLAEVTECLETLRRHGLLIPSEGADSETSYTLSTTIREDLHELLSWEPNERHELLKLVARFLRDRAFPDFRSDRKTLYRAIPFVAEALFHFKEAGDRRSYVATISEIAKPLIQMYHSTIVEKWLDGCPSSGVAGNVDDDADWRLALLRADIAIAQCVSFDLERQLALAEGAQERLKESGKIILAADAELHWYRGIDFATRHEYRLALLEFDEVAKNPDLLPRRCCDARLRIVQTNVSLGRLSEASRLLDEIERDFVDGALQLGVADTRHERSVIASHRSTIATVRLQLFGRRPKDAQETRDSLLQEAFRNADLTYDLSLRLSSTEERRDRPDKTGMGLGRLKRAQASFAGRDFEAAHTAARDAAPILAAIANNRWWLMSCHEISARSLTMLGQLSEAESEVDFAERILNASARKDDVRACELKFTRGLIARESRKLDEAVNYFEQSVTFPQPSLCVRALHLDFWFQSLALIQEHEKAKEVLDRYHKEEIEW